MRKPFTFSEIIVRNFGEEPAVLDSVALVNSTEDIELVGAMATLRLGQPLDWRGGAPTWPPPPTKKMPELHPLEGFVVPPVDTPEGERGVQIAPGLIAQPGNTGMFEAVAIDCHVGDVRYRYVYPYGLRTCAPPAEFRAEDAPPCVGPPFYEE